MGKVLMTEIKFVKTKKELQEAIENQKGINQVTFSSQYYLEEINPNANNDELYSHHERFKKNLHSKDDRAPEKIAPYINYFNRKYKKDNKHTQSDRHAAWAMFVELDTRIATQPLTNGSDVSALTSLSLLFSKFRTISRKYGADSRNFYETTYPILNDDLRPFTSKWHTKLSDEDQNLEFRSELEDIQKILSNLKDELNKISL